MMCCDVYLLMFLVDFGSVGPSFFKKPRAIFILQFATVVQKKRTFALGQNMTAFCCFQCVSQSVCG